MRKGWMKGAAPSCRRSLQPRAARLDPSWDPLVAAPHPCREAAAGRVSRAACVAGALVSGPGARRRSGRAACRSADPACAVQAVLSRRKFPIMVRTGSIPYCPQRCAHCASPSEDFAESLDRVPPRRATRGQRACRDQRERTGNQVGVDRPLPSSARVGCEPSTVMPSARCHPVRCRARTPSGARARARRTNHTRMAPRGVIALAWRGATASQPAPSASLARRGGTVPGDAAADEYQTARQLDPPGIDSTQPGPKATVAAK
jgi:hypothetical protein